MTDQPHTPTSTQIREDYAYLRYHFADGWSIGEERVQFDNWIAAEIAAAEQRGAEQAFRKTQQIIAGFEHPIDEARNRGDMINTGYLIQEIDQEIQDLMEGADNDYSTEG